MTRQQIKERATRRLVDNARDRHLRLENQRVEREEAQILDAYFSGINGLLLDAARREGLADAD